MFTWKRNRFYKKFVCVAEKEEINWLKESENSIYSKCCIEMTVQETANKNTKFI